MRLKELHNYSHVQLLLFLFILSFIFLMMGNGTLSLTHPDEVFYIQTAKEMIQKHSWMTPYIFDAPQFEKPIFAYWLFIIAIKIFGLTSFAGRFAPSLFGMLAIPVIYGVAWVLFKNKRLSFLSSLILMTSVIHIALSRAVLTDMIFSVWVTLAIGAFYWGYQNQQNKNKSLLLCGVFCGFAVLTKGLLGICFPFGAIALFLLFKKDVQFLKSWYTLFASIVILVIALPWHIVMFHLYGQPFLHEYFQNVHFRRILEAEHARANTWYFYPFTVVMGVMPWTVFLFSAIGAFIAGLKAKGKDQQPLLFLLAWVISMFIFVQPAASKLASYILPIFPAMAIILAYYLDKVIWGSTANLSSGFRRSGYFWVVMLFLAAIAIPFAAQKYSSYIPTYVPVWFLIFALIATGTILFVNLRRNKFIRVIGIIPVIPFVIIMTCALIYKHAEIWVSCKTVSEELKKYDQSNSTVLTSKFYVRGVRYYTDRPVAVIDLAGAPFFSHHPIPFLDEDNKVLKFLNTQAVTFCIVKKSSFENLERIILRGNFKLTVLSSRGGKYLLKIIRPN
ncbi:MAG: phospholipid carrier-dependent glycosyltransferase [Candidatus Omnitrophica bacterium]|nr:phospholipid carrier-dependent glycosyltransferase [Candidatus Omnitrophota bacterium]